MLPSTWENHSASPSAPACVTRVWPRGFDTPQPWGHISPWLSQHSAAPTLRLQQPGIGCLGYPRVPRGWALIISSFSPPSSYVSPLRYRWKRPPGQLGEPSLGRESRGCSEGWKHAGHCWGAHCPGEVLQNGQGYGKGGGKQQLDCRAGDHMPALLHPAGARKNPPTKNCSSASGHGISGKKKIMHSSFSCDVFSLFFGYRP